MRPSADELLRLVAESATEIAIMTTDKAGVVTSWNVGAERLMGWSEDEIVGGDSDCFFTPEDRAIDRPATERIKATSKGRAEDDRWHVRKDGTRFWGTGLLMPLADPDLGYVKILQDRTDQHRKEQELEETARHLRESEERFRLLATNIPQLVFRTRATGSRTWGSPQWVVYAGLSVADSLGFGWLDAIHPDDRDLTVAGWNRAQEIGEYHVEHRIRRAADGEYRWHQTRAVPIAADGDADGHLTSEWVGTSTDIHELRSLQDRQQVIVAEIQHRTRNLLALVQATARQTLRRSTSLDEFARDFEGRLRALSRVQSLLVRATGDTLDLRTIVDEELAAYRDAKIEIKGPPVGLPRSAVQVFALALHELATNAVKYGALAQPSGRIEVSWRIEQQPDDIPRVVLDWRESGIEIPDGTAIAKSGYGRELIERALRHQLAADTRFEIGPQGVFCQIAVPVEQRRGNDGQ